MIIYSKIANPPYPPILPYIIHTRPHFPLPPPAQVCIKNELRVLGYYYPSMKMTSNVIAMLLWCTIVCTQIYANSSTKITICVAGNDSECTIPADRNISQLSEIPAHYENESDIVIYLMQGNHSLSKNLDVGNQANNTELHGVNHSTSIECRNDSSIRFSNGQTIVKISNIIFIHCNSFREEVQDTVALYFNNTNTVLLDNVTVTGTRQFAYYALNCTNQDITNSLFHNNVLHMKIVAKSSTNVFVNIINCKFYKAEHIFPAITISTVSYSRNNISLNIESTTITENVNGVYISGVHRIFIADCFIDNNTGQAMSIYTHTTTKNTITIMNCTFTNNSNGGVLLLLLDSIEHIHQIRLQNSTFNLNSYFALWIAAANDNNSITLHIDDSIFEGNYGGNRRNCSVLHIARIKTATLNSVMFRNNFCVGMSLFASNIIVEQYLNITDSIGGAIALMPYDVTPRIMMEPNSRLNLLNNTADYGAGIFIDEVCEKKVNRKCFVDFGSNTSIMFSDNRANVGGDAIYGGCLNNCSLEETPVNISDSENIFWKHVSPNNPSYFIEPPTRVVFCTDTDRKCQSNHAMSAYRGQKINISMMVADDSCLPSAATINITSNTSLELSGHGPIFNMHGDCADYSYTITEKNSINSGNILFQISANIRPARLSITFEDCPPMLVLDDGNCTCNETLMSKYHIACTADEYSLAVPRGAWIGRVKGKIALGFYCMHCRDQDPPRITNITTKSKMLCYRKRTGVLCGSCDTNFSLRLGSYACGNCSSTTYKGILIIFASVFAGIILIIVLFALNLTVSSGVINGLVFYSNIVHYNTIHFLPVASNNDTNTTVIPNNLVIPGHLSSMDKLGLWHRDLLFPRL